MSIRTVLGYGVTPLMFAVVLLATILLAPTVCQAVEPVTVSPALPADQRTAFLAERESLLADKRRIDAKLARHNKNCTTPLPQFAPSCNDERLLLFQLVDSYQKKVSAFNRRVAAVDVPVSNKTHDAP